MRTTVLFFIFQLFACLFIGESIGAKPNIKGASPNKTLSFIENKGQWDDAVLFQCRLANMDVWITKTGVNYTWYKIKPDTTKPETPKRNPKLDYLAHLNDSLLIHRVIMDYAGANANPRGEGKLKQEAYSNYFIGTDTTKHASFVGLYNEVIVHDVYPHIDIRYYFERGQLRYDYVVNPGGDPKQIRFNYRGQYNDEVQDNQLVLSTRFGKVRVRDLYCYQEQEKVQGEFTKQDDYWQIALGTYNKQKPLIIDPLIFSTFLGGNASDRPSDIDIDKQGNSYIVGSTLSIPFDVTPGAIAMSGTGQNIFVSKFNASGSGLIFSSLIGGNNSDIGLAIKIDTFKRIYITGANAIGGYPVTANAFQTTNESWISQSCEFDAIITKFNEFGSGIMYSTYLGSADDDYGVDIDVDLFGCAYVTGNMQSMVPASFDITQGAYLTSPNGGASGFVTKINPTGTGLLYSTFLGGYLTYGTSIKVNTLGEAFVAGETCCNFPITPGAFQNNTSSGYSLFIVRLNANGSNLIYGSCIKANDLTYLNDLEIDNNNNAYVVGETSSTNFPTTAGVYQAPSYLWSHGYILKLNASGSNLIFSMLFDGNLNGIDIDNTGNVYVCGWNTNSSFVVTPGAVQSVKDSNEDAIVAKINSTGTALIYATFLGGAGYENAGRIKVDDTGRIYITGLTSSANFVATPNAFDNTFNGVEDAFVTKIEPCVNMSVSAASSSPVLCMNDTFPMLYHTCTGAYLLGTPVNLPPGLNATLSNDSIIISGTPLLGGIYNYQIPLLGSCGNIAATGTISISPYAILNSPNGSNNQQVCINSPLSPITYTLGGGANGATFSNLPPGVNGSLSNGIVSINGTPTQLGNYIYQITLTGGCDTTSIYGNIQVSNPTSIVLTSLPGTDSQTVCIETPYDTIKYLASGASGAIFSGFPVGTYGTFNNGVIKIFGKPVTIGNYTFQIQLIGGCDTVSATGTIHVLNYSSVYLTSAVGTNSQTSCINTPIIPITYSVTVATGVAFNGLPLGVSGSYSNGNITISGTPTVNGNFPINVILIGGCGNPQLQLGFMYIHVCAGLQEHEESEFVVYPNPATNSFTIVSSVGGNYILTDVSGKKVREYILTSHQQTISENLAAGVYFLREVQSGKVMKLVVE